MHDGQLAVYRAKLRGAAESEIIRPAKPVLIDLSLSHPYQSSLSMAFSAVLPCSGRWGLWILARQIESVAYSPAGAARRISESKKMDRRIECREGDLHLRFWR
jgi:hypothetical protein